jgi:hypothetical protein
MAGIVSVNCITIDCNNKVLLGIDICDECKGEEE